jgi:Ca2+-binding RTX toxin-like protein
MAVSTSQGSNGNDVLTGGAGNDTFTSGSGGGIVSAGAGNSTIVTTRYRRLPIRSTAVQAPIR